MNGLPLDSRSAVMGLSRATPLFYFINSEVPRKLKTKEIGIVNYTVENTPLGRIKNKKTKILRSVVINYTYSHKPKIRTQRSKTFLANFLSGLFTYQSKRTEQNDT